jgi:hypothetical protein
LGTVPNLRIAVLCSYPFYAQYGSTHIIDYMKRYK